ncbi:DEAD (Asp-Glu-Ala-Asp) box polypeptide 52, partial [Perkinsus chesapeaki]
MNSYFDILRAGTVLGRRSKKDDNISNHHKGNANPGTIQKASSIFLGGGEDNNNKGKELNGKAKRHSHRGGGGGKKKNKGLIEEGIDEDGDKADINVFDGDKQEDNNEGSRRDYSTIENGGDERGEGGEEEIKKGKKNKIISPARRLEMANHYRKENKIGVSGTSNPPDPILTFNEGDNHHDDIDDNRISKWLKDAMVNSGFPTPTPIQSQAIPLMLTGQHLLAQAPTGS